MNQIEPNPTFGAPPGPRSWPLVGNMWALRNAGDLLSYLEPQWRTHGDVFRIQLFGQSATVVSHPEAIKQVLSSRRDRYVKGKVYDSARRVLGDNLVTLERDVWKRRRALMQPSFHRQSLAKLTDSMVESGARAFDDLARRANGEPIALDAHREMVKVTLDVVICALFGRDLVSEARVSYEALGASLELASDGANGIVLPSWVPTPHNLKFQRTMREVDAAMYKLIAAARKRGADDGSLLSMLLGAVDEETGQALPDHAIRDEVFTLFVAGHETTALTLTWMFVLLDRRPDVLARMVDEVRTVLGGRDPGFDDVPRLAYVRQVVEETLRLRPPVALLPRNVIQDDEIGGYRIKAGETVFLLLWATHRHPEFWTKAEAFNPDRFGPDTSKGRHSWSYVPFSGGPRTCIGNMFALVESAVLVAQLLNRFDVEVQSCADVRPVAVATVRPSRPVGVVLRQKV